jgi:hypothetical protein
MHAGIASQNRCMQLDMKYSMLTIRSSKVKLQTHILIYLTTATDSSMRGEKKQQTFIHILLYFLLTYLLTYLLTHSLTHSPTHTLTHSMVQDI